jgi:hypothetical protein
MKQGIGLLEELKQGEFGRVIPLFQQLDHCMALRATIEHNNPGRIFVDNVDSPHTASALTLKQGFGSLCSGKPDAHNAQTTKSQYLVTAM